MITIIVQHPLVIVMVAAAIAFLLRWLLRKYTQIHGSWIEYIFLVIFGYLLLALPGITATLGK